MNEGDFQRQVLELAGYTGWRTYHTHDSRHSAGGWPDLVLIRPPELIIAELKGPTTRVNPDQQDWLNDLRTVTAAIAAGLDPTFATPRGAPRFDIYLWRPADWADIEKRLARPHA